MTDFKEIAERMKALDLQRDKPFAEPLAPTWEQELNAKLQPKPAPVPTPPAEIDWYSGC